MSKAMATIEGFALETMEFKEDAKDGIPLFTFVLAVPGNHDNEETSFFKIRAWGKRALIARGLVSKGAYVRVNGSIKIRKSTSIMPDGTEKTYYNTGIVMWDIDLPHMK